MKKIQPVLLENESIYWAGMPDPSVIFHSDDKGLIPFSLLWGGGWLLAWLSYVKGWSNLGHDRQLGYLEVFLLCLMTIFGQYLIWGRFLVDAWLKRRTYYAVTNQRAIFFQEGWNRRVKSVYHNEMLELNVEGTQRGTIWFGPKYPIFTGRYSKSPNRRMSRFSATDQYVFADIDGVRGVERLILGMRKDQEG